MIIGISNVMTPSCAVSGCIDLGQDGSCRTAATVRAAAARCLAGAELYAHDAVIHSRLVRFFTNSRHLSDFWKCSWYSTDEWRKLTGRASPQTPSLSVYAFGGVSDLGESVYSTPDKRSLYIFNSSYYENVFTHVTALMSVLLESESVLTLRGSVVIDVDMDSAHVIRSDIPGAAFAFAESMTNNGRYRLCPSGTLFFAGLCYKVRSSGDLVRIVTVDTPRGRLSGRPMFHSLLEGELDKDSGLLVTAPHETSTFELCVDDLDVSAGAALVAYNAGKCCYLETSVAKSSPSMLSVLLESRLKNVPQGGIGGISHGSFELADVVRMIKSEGIITGLRDDQIKEILVRFIAFPESRAMVDMTGASRGKRTWNDPLKPVCITKVLTIAASADGGVECEEKSIIDLVGSKRG